MGYRSDVMILVYGNALAMDAYVANWKAEETKGMSDQQTEDFYEALNKDCRAFYYNNDECKGLALEFDSVKWYESYTDVQRYTRFFKGAPNYHGLSYEYMRVGEEYDDNEQDYAGDNVEFFLRLIRSIDSEV